MSKRTGSTSLRAALRDWQARLDASSPSAVDTPTTPAEPICPVCHGAGWVLPQVGATMAEAVVCPAQCAAARRFIDHRRQARYSRAGIPEQYQRLTFATFEALTAEQRGGKLLGYAMMLEFVGAAQQVSLWAVARHLTNWFGRGVPARVTGWLQVPDVVKRGVVLQGEAGVGKTGLAIAAMNALLDQGMDVRYMRVYDVIVALRETWREGSERDILQDFQQCPVLVLDEFNLIDAQAVAKPHQTEYMTAIMRYREAAGRPTLITCNVGREQFYAQWGVQCADVVMALCHWVPVGGLKLRQTEQDLGDAL